MSDGRSDVAQGLLFGTMVPVGYEQPAYPSRRVMLSSDSEDWCTPPEVLEVIRRFGTIAFDPFSNPFSLVGALVAKQLPEDSLRTDWPGDGLIFCNPPYGRALDVCAAHIGSQGRHGCEILTLVPARTDTRWWHDLSAPVWCAWKGRIQFLETVESLQARHAERVAKAVRVGEKPPKPPRFEMASEHLARGETATFASALCYHGPRPERFVEVFGACGKIYRDGSRNAHLPSGTSAPALLDAVQYTLRRVGTDPDFRHHMLMTETMDRLCRALSEVTGQEFEALKREYSLDRQPDYRRREPQLTVERRQVATLERLVERLSSDAGIGWERLEELRNEATAGEG